MTTKDPSKLTWVAAQIALGTLTMDPEPFFLTCSNGCLRSIDSHSFNARYSEKFQEYPATTTNVQNWTGATKKLNVRTLDTANHVLAAAEFI